jgi:hypothetical protein
LKLIQEQAHNKIYIAAWDPDYDATEKVIKKPRDFPEGAAKKRKHYANYFSGYLNPKKNKTSKIYISKSDFWPPNRINYPSTSKRWVKNSQIPFLKRSQTFSSPRTHMHVKRYAPDALAGSLGPPSPSTVKNGTSHLGEAKDPIIRTNRSTMVHYQR